MTSADASFSKRLSRLDQLRLAKEILQTETRALARLAERLESSLCDAVEILYRCQGSAIVSGMGKAGLIGQKIAATLASTGTRSHFVHPSEALHGDLGRIHPEDCALVLSNSGETEEIVRLLPSLAELQTPVIAITSNPHSRLARRATVTLDLGVTKEACTLGLAPSASTTAMLALGDALALVTSRMKGFTSRDFARFHPGGSLGQKLSKVQDIMRPIDQCCVALDRKTLREIYVQASRPHRRSGAILLVNDRGALTGIFTDSDLARLYEHKRDEAVDGPIRKIMTQTPITIEKDEMVAKAVTILAERKISELPVVDEAGRPLGLIDITDVLGLLPRGPEAIDCDPPAARGATAAPDEPAQSATNCSPAPRAA